MKANKRIPLPESLDSYAALILFSQFKSQEEHGLKAREFLGLVASAGGVPRGKGMLWLPLLLQKTNDEALCFSRKMGDKIGYEIPVALVKGYMEYNGFRIGRDLENVIYSLALLISNLFEYEDFDELREAVRSLYEGCPELN